jgi:hypothetical protein
MRNLLLLIGLTLALAVALVPVAGGAPSPNACNQGTMMAHSKIPHDSPGHEHVPHCD